MKTLNAALHSRTTIAEHTIEFVFSFAEPFSFQAGQYVTITVSGLEALPIQKQFHDFSIASSPTDTKNITIALRTSESPFKQKLLTNPLGSRVIIEGPKGFFTAPKEIQQPIVFIAGGIGITPFLSIIRYIVEKKYLCDITILYYNKNRESAAYLDTLERIDKENKHISLVSVFGKFNGTEVREYIKNHSGQSTWWYVAGPSPMVATAQDFLAENNINEEFIKTEEFTGYEGQR